MKKAQDEKSSQASLYSPRTVKSLRFQVFGDSNAFSTAPNTQRPIMNSQDEIQDNNISSLNAQLFLTGVIPNFGSTASSTFFNQSREDNKSRQKSMTSYITNKGKVIKQNEDLSKVSYKNVGQLIQKRRQIEEVEQIMSPLSTQPISKDRFFRSTMNLRQRTPFIGHKNDDDQQLKKQIKTTIQTCRGVERVQQKLRYFKLNENLEEMTLIDEKKSKIMPQKFRYGDIMNYIEEMKETQADLNALNKTYSNKKFTYDISFHSVGQNYQSVVQNLICHADSQIISHFKANSINTRGADIDEISQNIPYTVENVELAKNCLNNENLNSIVPLIRQKDYDRLQYLNLSDNRLTDMGLQKLMKAVKGNNNLKKLDLSNNKLGDNFADMVNMTLQSNSTLEQLYLQYNLITSQGGSIIAEALRANNTIRVLDLSYNNLGKNPEYQSGLAIVQAACDKNSSMVHLDISNNFIPYNELLEIKTQLVKNHTLYGLHLEGNSGSSIDPQGFLSLPDRWHQDIGKVNPVIRKINGFKPLSYLMTFNKGEYLSDGTQIRDRDVCWICDGWQEKQFEMEPNQFSEQYVFLHLNFQNYQPFLMKKNEFSGKFQCTRMCPPNYEVLFYFSIPLKNQVISDSNYDLESYDQKFANIPQTQLQNGQAREKTWNQKYNDGSEFTFEGLRQINKIYTFDNQPVFDKYGNLIISTVPRFQEDQYYLYGNLKKEKKKWTFPISLFKDYQVHTPQLIKDCFENDWKNCKITKIIKAPEDLNEVKELLRQNYQKILLAYQYTAALGVVGQVFCVTTNCFTDFIIDTNLVDGKNFKLSDLDFNFIAANSNQEKSVLNPDRALVRHQLMEMFVRISSDQYFQMGASTYFDAINNFLNDGGMQQIQSFQNPQVWRDTRYWNEQCDLLLQAKQDNIQDLYSKFAGTRMSDQKGYVAVKRLSLSEFKDIVNQFSLYGEEFVERDVPVVYGLSMMTQIDELKSDRHIQMFVVEFMQALARMAQKLSWVPSTRKDLEELELSERKKLDLYIKLEALLEKIFNFNNKQDTKGKGGNFSSAASKVVQTQNSNASGLDTPRNDQVASTPQNKPSAFNTNRQMTRRLTRRVSNFEAALSESQSNKSLDYQNDKQ